PRPPEDLTAFGSAMLPVPVRNWELSNVRYLLGPIGIEGIMKQLDHGQDRLRVATRFNIVPKPGATATDDPEQWTAVTDPNGAFALFEFTGALPRAKLYSTWQTNLNDSSTLQALQSPTFDPSQSVLVSSAIPPSSTNSSAQAGSVEFLSYAPKRLELQCKAA